MQHRRLVRQPGDGIALARTGAVLDQVALPRACLARSLHQTTHRIQLVVARKDDLALAGLASLVVLALQLVDELLDQVEHAVARPCLLPQIGRGVALPGRWIASAAIATLVEWQKARPGPLQARGHVDKVRIHRKMRQAAPEGEQRFLGVAVGAVLLHGAVHCLAAERVLELGGEDRQPVEE